MPEDEMFLTIRGIAKKTRLSECFLRKAIKDGKIPVVWCGNRAKLSITMLMDALKNQAVSGN